MMHLMDQSKAVVVVFTAWIQSRIKPNFATTTLSRKLAYYKRGANLLLYCLINNRAILLRLMKFAN